MLVLDPFVGPRAEGAEVASAEGRDEHFDRAVSMAASVAWHFYELNSVMQFRTNRFSTPLTSSSEIIYEILRELALAEPDRSATGGAFLDDLASEQEVFKIILTARPQTSIPSALWSSSYFIFLDRL